MLQVDRLAVVFLGSMTGLTYYAVPASVASRVNAIGTAVAGLFFSRASALHAAGNRVALRQQHDAATRLLIWVTVSAAAPLVWLGDAFLQDVDRSRDGDAGRAGADRAGPRLRRDCRGHARRRHAGRLRTAGSDGAHRAGVVGPGRRIRARARADAGCTWRGVCGGRMAGRRGVHRHGAGAESGAAAAAPPRTGSGALGLVLVVAATAGAAHLARPFVGGFLTAVAGLAGGGPGRAGKSASSSF